MPSESETMSPEENEALVRRFVEAALNQNKLDTLPTFFALDVLGHYPQTEETSKGIEGLKQQLGRFLMAFPDFHITIDDLVAQADKVAWRWTFTGTHKGMYREFPPTNRSVTISGASFEHFAAGKIVERWASIPECAILRQIGAYTV